MPSNKIYGLYVCLYCTVCSDDTPAVSNGQLRKQEQDEELGLINQEESEGSCSELPENGSNEEAVLLGPRLVHT